MTSVFHVATSGSDTAAGSAGDPFRTINRAAALAQAGDTVVVHGASGARRTRKAAWRCGFLLSGMMRSIAPTTDWAKRCEKLRVSLGAKSAALAL